MPDALESATAAGPFLLQWHLELRQYDEVFRPRNLLGILVDSLLGAAQDFDPDTHRMRMNAHLKDLGLPWNAWR